MPTDFLLPFRKRAYQLAFSTHAAAAMTRNGRGAGGSALKGQAGRLTKVTPNGTDGIRRRLWTAAWVALLFAILVFLVIYPLLTLLLGALTDTNPVVDGFSLRHLSITHFLAVLVNPNVAEALANTLIACGGGTLIAVVIGLGFSWIVVRTNTRSRASSRPPASCRCSLRRWSRGWPGAFWARRKLVSSTPCSN